MNRQRLSFTAVMLLAALGTPVTADAQDTAAPQDISVQLSFDRQPLENTAPPAFTCFDEVRQAWIGCRVSRGPDGYVMARPTPGRYTLHVEINENGDNPARFPGDFDVFQTVEIAAGTSALHVNMLQVMHLTAPWDNNASVDGMLTRPWSEKPALETAPNSRVRVAPVTFTWDAVAPGAEYRYEVHAASGAPYERGPEVIRGTTHSTTLVLRLPVSAIGKYFQFGLTAYKAGQQVGELFTHDAGVQAWTADFVVKDSSGQPNAAAPPVVVPPAAPLSEGDAAFLAEWRQAIPQPAWWDDVAAGTPAINSYGDLMGAWQSAGDDTISRERFYKAAYQGVVDHPGDQHLAATAIDVMAYGADVDDRLALLTFGVDHFFSYNQRTDNCANCQVGDAIGTIVRDLAEADIARGQPQAAIDLIQRLVVERGRDVSAYNLALTFEVMSRAYWDLTDVDGAKAAIEEGLRRFPIGWQADQLRRTLDRYEKESADKIAN